MGTVSFVHRIPRLVRFAFVGGTCAAIQLLVLLVLVIGFNLAGYWAENISNVFAFFLSALVNFLLSSAITWSDRWDPTRELTQQLKGRFASFMGMVFLGWLVNQTTFVVVNLFLDYRIAGLAGILTAAVFTYMVSNKIVFNLREDYNCHLN